ncbi:DUF6538 domain-containing protein [Devosia alba]|uniref:DUF6538 domain-containing protein n=1 Tax=Devosia alba TaxID=3152360 RepID=UPI003D35A496
MDAILARKTPYLLFRDGRYCARRTVPPKLRSIVGTRELREPLGPNRRVAIERLPVALITINARLDHARHVLAAGQGTEAAKAVARAAPMTPSEMARAHYNEQLALDDALRNSGPSWANVGINDSYVADLRAAASGSLHDEQVKLYSVASSRGIR